MVKGRREASKQKCFNSKRATREKRRATLQIELPQHSTPPLSAVKPIGGLTPCSQPPRWFGPIHLCRPLRVRERLLQTMASFVLLRPDFPFCAVGFQWLLSATLGHVLGNIAASSAARASLGLPLSFGTPPSAEGWP